MEDIEIMEIDQDCDTVEFTSFTDFVDEKAFEDLRKYWRRIERAHKKHGLCITLNQEERTITLSTTTETTNPHIIHKARACIVLVAQFAFPITAAYRGIDNRRGYEFIQTGYQDYGIAGIHGLDKEQYVIRRRRLFEHARVVAAIYVCKVNMNEDCLLVSGSPANIKNFKTVVEKCILEDFDPTTLKGFGKWQIQKMMKFMKV